MESTRLYKNRVTTLKDAINGFDKAMTLDLSALDDVTEDAIRCGQVQKFEYCIELLWKTLKQRLWLFEGVDESSPKAVIKATFRTLKLQPGLYEALLQMIDDRNHLSHLYRFELFEEVYQRLTDHLAQMKKLLSLLD